MIVRVFDASNDVCALPAEGKWDGAIPPYRVY